MYGARSGDGARGDTPGQPVPPGGVASRRVENPRSMRALAHPARLAIVDVLRTGDELTATQCAELTGLSPSATAYHLKFLERYGFVEPAPLRVDRRERPWRAPQRRTQVALDGSTAAGASAAAAVVAFYIEATRDVAVRFAQAGAAESEDWGNGVVANADLWLTPEEFRRVARELDAVLEPYRQRASRNRPERSRRVRVMNVVVPHHLD